MTNYLNLSLKKRHFYDAGNLRIYGNPCPTLGERYKHCKECAKGDKALLNYYQAISLRRHIIDLQKAYPEYCDKFTSMLQRMPDNLSNIVPKS